MAFQKRIQSSIGRPSSPWACTDYYKGLQNITKDKAFMNRPTSPNKAKCKKNKIKIYITLEIRGHLCDVVWLEMWLGVTRRVLDISIEVLEVQHLLLIYKYVLVMLSRYTE